MIREATPSTVAAVLAQSISGDVVVLGAGAYGSLPQRSGVILRAVDHGVGRVVTDKVGHLGAGMAVSVTGPLNVSTPGVTLEGIFHDTRGYSGINAGVISANDVRFHDCVAAARPVSGARQIGYTVGTGTTRITGFRFLRGRHQPTGQAGQKLDHAFYIKNASDWEIADSIIVDGGRFPLHLYTNADNGRFLRNIVWDSVGAITFSGASDSSTGTSIYGTSDGNLVEGCILGRGRSGYLVESWTSDATRPVVGNVVRDCIVTKGGGAAGTVQPGMRGVTLTAVIDRDPGFADWQNGDWRNQSGYGPSYLLGPVEPPIDPPPPPSDPCASLRIDLAGAREARDQAIDASMVAVAERDSARVIALELKARIDAAKAALG